MPTNPNAIYVYCDGSMDYDSKSTGGVGYAIVFPDSTGLDEVKDSLGRYQGANIVRLEMEGIIQGLIAVINAYEQYGDRLNSVNAIILITDRFDLSDCENTNVYKIDAWRKNKWHNYEGVPIKNHDLIDKIDKKRKKLNSLARCRVEIKYRRRKYNKTADKLAKKGKREANLIDSIAVKGTKVGRRFFGGNEVLYKNLIVKDYIKIHIYKKDPVQNEWSVSSEIIEGENKGKKLKIYVDDVVAMRLNRHHCYRVRIKEILTFGIRVYKTITEIKNKKKYSTQL